MSTEKPDILIAEDDPAMLRMLAKWLEAGGYSVRCAGDGRQAQAAIQSACPRILVTDWEMPHVDGLGLCRWLRAEHTPHYVYVVFVTARSGVDSIVQGLEAGADDFIRKPVDRGELLARIRSGERVLEMERRLSQLVRCDLLTGVATKRAFLEQAEAEWARSQRYRSPLSCVMLDIDFFKRVNDTYGHAAGDDVIRSVAAVLSQNCRASDVVGRLGGEEFCVLLPETKESEAAYWADRVREKIAEQPLTVQGRPLTVTASFGVAQRLADTRTPADAIDMADQALLVAKQSGRDRVVAYQAINASAALQGHGDGAGTILSGLRARDVMNPIVAALHEGDSVGAAVDFFLRMRLNAAPVVNEQGKLAGILSEKDALSILLWPNWKTLQVRDVMKRHVVSYEDDSPLLAIYDFLCRVAIRGVVIVQDGRPVGMIGRGSLLRWFFNRGQQQDGNGNLGMDRALCLEQLGATVGLMSEECRRLASCLASEGQSLAPGLVSGASRMQDLVTDLLASSRFADAPASQADGSVLAGAALLANGAAPSTFTI